MTPKEMYGKLHELTATITQLRSQVASMKEAGASDGQLLTLDTCATDMAEESAQLVAALRRAVGNTHSDRAVRNVRKALGFTTP